METLGNILHSVGETVGIVSHKDEKKEMEEPEKKQGFLSSIAEAAHDVLAPPPLDADPIAAEKVAPLVPVRSLSLSLSFLSVAFFFFFNPLPS